MYGHFKARDSIPFDPGFEEVTQTNVICQRY